MNKSGRKMIVVDVRKTMTAEAADYFIQVEPNKDYEILMRCDAWSLTRNLTLTRLAESQLNTLKKSLTQW